MRRGWRLLDEDLGSGDWRDEDWGRLIGPTKIWTTGTWTQQGVQETDLGFILCVCIFILMYFNVQ